MAQDHTRQDTPSTTATKAQAYPRQDVEADLARGRRLDAARVLLLGLNAWMFTTLWPLTAGAEVRDLLFAGAALTPLALGLGALSRTPLSTGRPVARLALLTIYPAGLVLVGTTRSAWVNHSALPPWLLSLAALSLAAYLAVSAQATERAEHLKPADYFPAGPQPWDAEEGRRGLLRPALVALLCTGAFAVAVVAPSLGGLAALRSRWGESALEGGSLTAVVGIALGGWITAVSLSSLLRRAEARDEPPGARQSRVAILLFLTLFGAMTYFVTRP